jgi:hypothetical protein
MRVAFSRMQGGLAVEVEPEHAEDRVDLHAREPVRPAGEPAGLVGDLQQDRRDREREHEQRQRLGAQDDRAGGQPEQRRHAGGRRELQERLRHAELRAQDSRGIGAEPEERAVAERDDAGVAEDQVERQREQDEDQDARPERQVLRQQEESRQREHPRRPLRPADARIDGIAAHDLTPNSPCGRHRRTPMVAA